VNGVAATEQDHVQNEIVKQEWGFDGLIMSDWFATKTAAAAANGGLDLVMPGPAGPWGDALVHAVQAGEVAESVIDDHVQRILRLADRVGALGAERKYPADLPAPDSTTRKEQLTRLAAEGITVLTNKNSALPLAGGTRVALIGRHAVETIDMGGGSAQVNPPYQVSVADGLTALLGDAVTVTDGVEVRNRHVPAHSMFVFDPVTGAPGTHVRVYAADGVLLDDKHIPGALILVGFDDNYPAPVSRVVMAARLASTEQVELGVVGKGDWTVRNGNSVTRFEVRSTTAGFADDMLAPPSRTEVVTVNDTGIVEIELELSSGGTGPMDNIGTVGLVARLAPRDQDQVIADAVASAAVADVAVVVVGLTEEQETEAVDKTTLHLTGRQDDLVRAVAAAAPRTVVVVNAATPVIMPWIDQVDAVLWAGLPGQEGGHAIAAALLGHIEPAGRLVTTFPTDDALTPAWNVTPVDGDVVYSEDTAIGYRGHHAGIAPTPAFWLGHGLGYSTWEYSTAELHHTQNAGSPTVSVTVTNTGTRTSREVVQVYYQPTEAGQPVRLVGWHAVTVEPGASGTVHVTPDARMWRRWNTATHTWNRLSGAGQLLIARGLGDIRATLTIP
jgi:beta-glucosidase